MQDFVHQPYLAFIRFPAFHGVYCYCIFEPLGVEKVLLGGPFDLVSRVSKVGLGFRVQGLLSIPQKPYYNPPYPTLLTLLTKSKGPPSRVQVQGPVIQIPKFRSLRICVGTVQSEEAQVFLGFPSGNFYILLKGSWDLVTRVIIRVTILIITYNPT